MALSTAAGFNYLGTIDDVAVRFPWRFKLTESALNHSLITQLLDGRPVLLNDGYLVHHPIARQSLLDQNSLLWELMRVGFVRVMARGGKHYTLAQMPEKMAPKVRSFAALINDQIRDVDWLTVRTALDATDRLLRRQGHLLDWPAFDSSSGFRAFAQHLLTRQSTPHSLGMGRAVRGPILQEFLQRYLGLLDKNLGGPRDTWEKLAVRMSKQDDKTHDAKAFVQSLMNLATETYHYNMGVMLSAHYQVPVSVETQTSPAFDDLLIRPDVVVDELPVYPRLHAPLVLATVDPKRLVSIVEDPSSKIFQLRAAWMQQRDAWELQRLRKGSLNKASQRAELKNLKEAAREYVAALTQLLGKRVKYEQSEGMFHTVVGAVVKDHTAAVSSAAGITTAAALAALHWPATGVIVAGVAAGYVVSQTQKKLLGGVTRKFRVKLLEKQLLPPEWLDRSQRLIAKINARRTPSAIEIDTTLASGIIKQLKPFVPN